MPPSACLHFSVLSEFEAHVHTHTTHTCARTHVLGHVFKLLGAGVQTTIDRTGSGSLNCEPMAISCHQRQTCRGGGMCSTPGHPRSRRVLEGRDAPFPLTGGRPQVRCRHGGRGTQGARPRAGNPPSLPGCSDATQCITHYPLQDLGPVRKRLGTNSKSATYSEKSSYFIT